MHVGRFTSEEQVSCDRVLKRHIFNIIRVIAKIDNIMITF